MCYIGLRYFINGLIIVIVVKLFKKGYNMEFNDLYSYVVIYYFIFIVY